MEEKRNKIMNRPFLFIFFGEDGTYGGTLMLYIPTKDF
jgi:hypothetical protein